MELLDFVTEQEWVFCFEGEMYTKSKYFNLRVELSDGHGKKISKLLDGWIGSAHGYSFGDIDTALIRLANDISDYRLGTYCTTDPDVLAETGRGFDTVTLVTAPRLQHTIEWQKFLEKDLTTPQESV